MENECFAKPGEMLSKRAFLRLHDVLSLNEDSDIEVMGREPGDDPGGFVCIDCGDRPSNNMQANTHGSARHRIAWLRYPADPGPNAPWFRIEAC